MGRREDVDVSGLRVPPHSDEAEQAVLGALLLDNTAWDRCADLLHASDFYHADHRAIYTTLGALINANKPADVITVFEAGGHDMPYLHSLTSSVPGSGNVRAYANIVRERSLRRQLVVIGDELASAGFIGTEDKAPIERVVDRAVTGLMGLMQGEAKSEPRDISGIVVEFVDHVNDAYEGKTDAIETGLVDVDRMLNGGLRAGELMVIGARPSMGKTATVLTLLRNIGRQHAALGLTMEDSLIALVSRMVAAEGGINLADIRNPRKAPDAMWGQLSEGVDAVGRLAIDLDDQPGLALMDVRRKIQQSRRRRGGKPHGLVVIDYLQLMEGEGDNRNQSLGAIANGLKRAAKEFNCPIVLLSQLNREADKRPGPPQMSDLRDSGDIEGAADIIVLLYREFMRKPTAENKHHMEMHFVKHKNGATGSVDVHFDGVTQRIGNWSGPPPSKMSGRSSKSSAAKGMD